MANLLDYVYWRGDLSFEVEPFNVVDNMVFCEMSYVDFSKSVKKFPTEEKRLLSKSINKIFKDKNLDNMVLGLIMPKEIIKITDKVKDTIRFGSVYASNYINIVDKEHFCQFSAMCFHLPNNTICVTYRGTDDTLIGWQEDLDMVCKFPIPAQKKAAEYLNKIASLFPDEKIIITGHSKGGNLATYAAIYCDETIKDRIVTVYSNDGPGFVRKHMDINKFSSISEKIIRVIPESSVIGMILDIFCGKTITVKSSAKGIYQHDAFSWLVDVNKFETVADVTDNCKKLDVAITKLLERLNDEERKDLAENFYNFVIETNKDTLSECHRETISLLKYLKTINKKNMKIFMELIYNFIRYKQI